MVYGLAARQTQLPTTEADLFNLFVQFSSHLLSNAELEAIKLLNNYRSQFHLARLPNKFKATDVLVEHDYIRPNQNTPGKIDAGICAMYHSSRKHSRSLLASVMRDIDKSKPLDPLTDVEDLDHARVTLSSKTSRGKRKHRQYDYQPTADDSDTAEGLPTVIIPGRSVKGPVSNLQLVTPQTSPGLEHSITTLTAAVHQVTSVYAHNPHRAIKTPARGRTLNGRMLRRKMQKGFCRITWPSRKKCRMGLWSSVRRLPTKTLQTNIRQSTGEKAQSYLSKKSSNLLIKRRSSRNIQSVLPNSSSKGSSARVQLTTDTKVPRLSRKRKAISDGAGESLEDEHPVKRRGITPDVDPSLGTMPEADNSDMNFIFDNEPYGLISPSKQQDTAPRSDDGGTFLSESTRTADPECKKSTQEGTVNSHSATSSVPEKIAMVKRNFAPSEFCPTIGERRVSRRAAQMASGKIHKQYVNPYGIVDNVEPSAEPTNGIPGRSTPKGKDNANNVKGKGEVKGKGGGGGKGKGRGKGKGKGKHKGTPKGKGKGDIELPIANPGIPQLHLIASGSSDPTHVSSPATVSSSPSTVVPSSPVQESLARVSSAVQPVRKKRGRSPRRRNASYDIPKKTTQMDGPELNHIAPSSSNNIIPEKVFIRESMGEFSAWEEPKGGDNVWDENPSTDSGQYIQSTSQSSDSNARSLPNLHAPWALLHDETNYSNGSRPPGINDTHSWSMASSLQTQKVNFPPLQGESLCLNIRLYKPKLPKPPPVWANVG